MNCHPEPSSSRLAGMRTCRRTPRMSLLPRCGELFLLGRMELNVDVCLSSVACWPLCAACNWFFPLCVPLRLKPALSEVECVVKKGLILLLPLFSAVTCGLLPLACTPISSVPSAASALKVLGFAFFNPKHFSVQTPCLRASVVIPCLFPAGNIVRSSAISPSLPARRNPQRTRGT